MGPLRLCTVTIHIQYSLQRDGGERGRIGGRGQIKETGRGWGQKRRGGGKRRQRGRRVDVIT